MMTLFAMVAIAIGQTEPQPEPDPFINANASRIKVRAFVGDIQEATQYGWEWTGDGIPETIGQTLDVDIPQDGDITLGLYSRPDIVSPWTLIDSEVVTLNADAHYPAGASPVVVGEEWTMELGDDPLLPISGFTWRILESDDTEIATGSGATITHTFGRVNNYTPYGTTYKIEITATNAVKVSTQTLTITPIPALPEEIQRLFELAAARPMEFLYTFVQAVETYVNADPKPTLYMELALRSLLASKDSLRAVEDRIKSVKSDAAKIAEIDAAVADGEITQAIADQLMAEHGL